MESCASLIQLEPFGFEQLLDSIRRVHSGTYPNPFEPVNCANLIDSITFSLEILIHVEFCAF
ncbi:hypothetical protein NC77_15840 [Janthinobacterium lividum]|nr:hypothetical protein NC77_15840 [Janthinobacterium lividum]